MMRKFLISFFVMILLCSSTYLLPVKASDEYTPTIPWSQFLHDARHTGKSPYSGNFNIPKILWKFSTEVRGSVRYLAIDKNGDIYFTLRTSGSTYLYMLYPNGSLKKEVPIPEDSVGHSPAIDNNGTIYISSAFATPFPGMKPLSRKLFAFNHEGKIIWNIILNRSFADLGDPVVYGNRLYLTSYGESLYAISTDGKIIWEKKIHPTTNPSLNDEGDIFICAGKYLYSLSSNGNIIWKIEIGETWWGSIPVIGYDGTIYVANENDTLYAINHQGVIKWTFPVGGVVPTIDDEKDSLYFVSQHYENNQDKVILYSLDIKDGTIKWKVKIMNSTYPNLPSLTFFRTVSGDGTVYVSGGFVKNNQGFIYAVSPTGKIKWHINMEGVIPTFTTPVIGKDGVIYLGTTNGTLYAIGGYATDNTGNKGNNEWNYFIAVIGAIGIVVAGVWIYYFRKRR